MSLEHGSGVPVATVVAGRQRGDLQIDCLEAHFSALPPCISMTAITLPPWSLQYPEVLYWSLVERFLLGLAFQSLVSCLGAMWTPGRSDHTLDLFSR